MPDKGSSILWSGWEDRTEQSTLNMNENKYDNKEDISNLHNTSYTTVGSVCIYNYSYSTYTGTITTKLCL